MTQKVGYGGSISIQYVKKDDTKGTHDAKVFALLFISKRTRHLIAASSRPERRKVYVILEGKSQLKHGTLSVMEFYLANNYLSYNFVVLNYVYPASP